MNKSHTLKSEDDYCKFMLGANYWDNPKYRPNKSLGEGPESYPCIVLVQWYTTYYGREKTAEEYVYPDDFKELDYYSKPIADAAKAWHAARETYLTIRTEDLRVKEMEALHKLEWMIDAEKNGWDPDYCEPED